jgi:ParB family chromosome partitioning protein
MGHARALLSLDDPELIKKAREEILKKHPNVRATEALVRRLKSPAAVKPVEKSNRELIDLAEQLKRRLQTKVEIRAGKRGGKIEISYGGRDELTRVLDLLGL